MDHSVFTLLTHRTCLYLVSVHQTAPPLARSSSHLITAYYSFTDPMKMRGWGGLQQTVYPYKWLPISCRSVCHSFTHWCRPGKVRRSEIDVLPLSYTTTVSYPLSQVISQKHWDYYYYARQLCRSPWVECSSPSVCPQRNSKWITESTVKNISCGKC